MDAQEVEGRPGYTAAVEWSSGRMSWTGIYDCASDAWWELLEQRELHENRNPDTDVLSKYCSHMEAINGVLVMLETGEPRHRVTWANLLTAEFGINPDGTGQLVLPDPNNSELTITYRVEVS